MCFQGKDMTYGIRRFGNWVKKIIFVVILIKNCLQLLIIKYFNYKQKIYLGLRLNWLF